MRLGALLLGFLTASTALAGYSAPRDFAGYRWRSSAAEIAGLELLGADVAELANGRNVLVEYRAPVGGIEFPVVRFRHVSFLFCGARARPGFCGVVLRFDDEQDTFGQIVAELIGRHGEPVEDETGFPVVRLVWGGKGRNDVAPIHPVAITLTFDPRTGTGEIIYATPELYRLAYRMYAYGDPAYSLYHRLQGGGSRRHSNWRACAAGACAVERRPLSEEETAEFDPRR